MPTDDSGALAFERAGKIDMARLNRRHEREKHCRSNADRDAEQENAPIQLSGIINRDPGHRWWKREHERVAAPIGDRDSAERGDQRKKQAFGEELLDQTAASGAQRKPHRHFMSAQE